MSETEKTGVHVTVTGSAARRRRILRIAGYTAGVGACLVFMAIGTVFGYFLRNSTTFAGLVSRNGLKVLVGAAKLNPLEACPGDKTQA